MGFGWLFLGYFFANIMEPSSPLSFAMLAGYPMMIMGLWHLAHYHTRFFYTFFVSFASVPFALYYALCALEDFGLFALDFLHGAVLEALMQSGYSVFFLAFTLMVLYAIAGLCKELGLYSLMTTAWRNFLLIGIFGVFQALSMLPFLHGQAVFTVTLMVFRLICVVMNVLLCYKCYRYICPEGQEDNPAPSKKSFKKREDEK